MIETEFKSGHRPIMTQLRRRRISTEAIMAGLARFHRAESYPGTSAGALRGRPVAQARPSMLVAGNGGAEDLVHALTPAA